MVLTAGLMVHAPMSATVTADPTQLPAATGQTRSGGSTYGRNLTANQTYVDPTSGVTVLRVTDRTHPTSAHVSHGYATSGPRCSLPWVDSGDGHTKYTIALDYVGYFVDIDYNDFQAENFRDAGAAAGPGDTGMAFSLNVANPRRSYYIDSGTIRAFDTDTMQVITPTGFPLAGQSADVWLQTMLNDTWLAFMDGQTYKAYKPSTGTVISMSEARSGYTHDELHIDKLNPYIYLSTNEDVGANALWNLEADTYDATPDSQTSNGPMSDDHAAGGYGFVCGMAHFAANGGGAFVYRGDTNVATQIINGAANYHIGEFYHNADWCVNRRGDTMADQWFLTCHEIDDSASWKVRQYGMAMVKGDGSDLRLVGHHDSTGTAGYEHFAKARLSPDGKLVIWTSDMNDTTSGHPDTWDVFVAKMPVS